MAVPRAAAARATATSPSGWTAWTPVGDTMTGKEISWPITLVVRSRLGGLSGHVGSEAEFAEGGDVVLEGGAPLRAGDQRAVHRLRQPLAGPPLRLGHCLEPLVCHADLSAARRPSPRNTVTGRLYAPRAAAHPGAVVAPVRSTPPGRRPPSLTPEDKAARASSFGDAATHYERFRPGPPAAAVDWVLPAMCAASSTSVPAPAGSPGGWSAGPTRWWRWSPTTACARCCRGGPEVRALAGRGESIPLEDGSADAVLASSSWHWMDTRPHAARGGPGARAGRRARRHVERTGSAMRPSSSRHRRCWRRRPSPVGELRGGPGRRGRTTRTANQVLEIPPGVPSTSPR